MTAAFVIAFFAGAAFLYAPREDVHTLRQWVAHITLCVLIGAVVAGLFASLGLFDLPGIDPNEGQYM